MKMCAEHTGEREVLDFMQRNASQVVSKLRWLVVCALWGLLLFSVFLFAFGAGASPVVAASKQTSMKKVSAAPLQELSTIAFSISHHLISEDAGSGLVVLLVSPPSSTPVTVNVASGNIQAIAPYDFEGLRQSLVISPGEATYTLSVTIFDDTIVEGDEQLRLTLNNYQGVLPGVITETLITIVDNDVAYLGISDVTVSEAEESVELVITQSVTSTLETLVDVRTMAGSATAPEDFSALITTVTIPPGNTSATVTVALNDDAEVEATETFTVQLVDATNAVISDGVALVTLLDDDFFPQLQLQGAEANERDGILPFVVTLSSSWAQTVTVDYATVDGSAVAPEDYLSTTGVLSFPPGVLTATVAVTLVVDAVDEPDETLSLVFTNPVQAILSSSQAEGVIRDDAREQLFLPGLAR